MSGCVWCGSPAERAAACLTCAPEQGHARDPDHDSVFEPTAIEHASLENLRAMLDDSGIPEIVFPPDEPEWFELNEARFLDGLHPR
ncbi:MAG TPA: hypothetical protein VGI10_10060 [Polyangiaceae bacterium]